VYFFFQAEDGIRDFHVTGVQTCALPIFGRAWNENLAVLRCVAGSRDWPRLQYLRSRLYREPCAYRGQGNRQIRRSALGWYNIGRSEERRVGEEGRGRGVRGEGNKRRA